MELLTHKYKTTSINYLHFYKKNTTKTSTNDKNYKSEYLQQTVSSK